jgi:hypothetical protein
MNLGIPKVAAKFELLFNKLATAVYLFDVCDGSIKQEKIHFLKKKF